MKIKGIFKNIGKIFKKHAPEILTGVGIVGMAGTVYLVVDKYEDCKNDLNNYAMDHNLDYVRDIPAVTKLKIIGKNMYRPVITFTASTVCLISSTAISVRRGAALTASYQFSNELVNQYRARLAEQIGEDEAKKIDTEINQKVSDTMNAPVPKMVQCGMLNKSLIYDNLSGRYFYDDPVRIAKVVNEFVSDIQYSSTFASLDELYGKIDNEDLRSCEFALYVGWNAENIPVLDMGGSIVAPNGEPALIMSWESGHRPFAGFEKF